MEIVHDDRSHAIAFEKKLNYINLLLDQEQTDEITSNTEQQETQNFSEEQLLEQELKVYCWKSTEIHKKNLPTVRRNVIVS